jgi:hypothetical protein
MPRSSSSKQTCAICGKKPPVLPEDKPTICGPCAEKSEILFEKEMGRIELLRTIRGQDVELYDIKHPDATADKNHCGQVILIKVGQGFEAKICLRSNTIDWMEPLSDDETGFTSQDTRLDALIGNVSLLMESWGGGPHYMDILDVTKVVSTEGEI